MSWHWVRLFVIAGLYVLLLGGGTALAAIMEPDAGIRVTVPDDWEKTHSSYAATNTEVTRIFDCTSEDAAQLKYLGWKTTSDGQVAAAFCISYQKSGIGKMRTLLQNSKGKERDTIAAKFLDAFAGKLKSEYMKRKMSVADLSADLLEVGDGFVLVMDGKIVDGTTTRVNSSTVFLQDDALLRISFVYDESVAAAVVEQLDAIPLSVIWK